MPASRHPSRTSSATPLHTAFLSLLPRVQTHARIAFRDIRCPAQKEEVIQEVVALAWRWFLRLHERGKDVSRFEATFVTLVARAVRSGRRVCGQEPARDVLSPTAQRRHDFRIEALMMPRPAHDGRYAPPRGRQHRDAIAERLRDNTLTPVLDQVQFRVDFPCWRATFQGRDRRVLDQLMRDERTSDVARRFGLSPARISQLRGQFRASWAAFCDGPTKIAGMERASA